MIPIERALGLDLASLTGWAVVERQRVIHGTWPESPIIESDGVFRRRYSSLFTWLDEMHTVHGFTAVGYETPWMNAERDTMNTLRILTGYPIIVETWCGLRGISRCCEVESRLVKKAMTGDFFAHASGNREKQKRNMMAAARNMGFRIGTDDEADAIAVGMCTIQKYWPRVTT